MVYHEQAPIAVGLLDHPRQSPLPTVEPEVEPVARSAVQNARVAVRRGELVSFDQQEPRYRVGRFRKTTSRRNVVVLRRDHEPKTGLLIYPRRVDKRVATVRMQRVAMKIPRIPPRLFIQNPRPVRGDGDDPRRRLRSVEAKHHRVPIFQTCGRRLEELLADIPGSRLDRAGNKPGTRRIDRTPHDRILRHPALPAPKARFRAPGVEQTEIDGVPAAFKFLWILSPVHPGGTWKGRYFMVEALTAASEGRRNPSTTKV